MDDDLDPELIRFLREELGHDAPDQRTLGGVWQHSGPLWKWRGKSGDGARDASSSSWHFITIEADLARQMRSAAPATAIVWGTLKVNVRLGDTEWQTAMFPQKDTGGYLLPVKAAVRKQEGVGEGDVVTVELSL